MYTQLPEGERCLARSNQHWITLIGPILLSTLGAGLWIYAALYFDSLWWTLLPIALLLWGVVLLVIGSLRYCSTEFLVTDKRIILKKGILTREALELMIDKCEGVLVTQSIWGRLLGYGTITVTTGEVSNRYDQVRDPLAFRNAISAATSE